MALARSEWGRASLWMTTGDKYLIHRIKTLTLLLLAVVLKHLVSSASKYYSLRS